MRKKIQEQQPLMQGRIDHTHAAELQAMSDLLDAMPEILDFVEADLLAEGVRGDVGRTGMTAEQVLRVVLVKQMNGFSYERLAFHLADSRTYRRFCRFGDFDTTRKKSTLQENIKRLREETLEAIHRLLVNEAKRRGIENGQKVRVDCTVTETNIHAPTDSSLLWDSVRVLTRLLEQLFEAAAGAFDVRYKDHTRRAKRRFLAIRHAGRAKKRFPLYVDLLKVARKTVGYAEKAVEGLEQATSALPPAVVDLKAELAHFVALARRVIDQTHRRVIKGESVSASDKVVSIFEEHSDIIVKNRRDTEYGHKVCLTAGTSSLVLDCVVEDGNPADATLAIRMIQRQKDIYGRLPRQAAFDGGFASRENLRDIKTMGVADVAFHKKRGLEVSDMARSSWVYRQLTRFRAGVEGIISFLKRCFGLGRCTWSGKESFKAYVWSSVITANLLTMARHMLA